MTELPSLKNAEHSVHPMKTEIGVRITSNWHLDNRYIESTCGITTGQTQICIKGNHKTRDHTTQKVQKEMAIYKKLN